MNSPRSGCNLSLFQLDLSPRNMTSLQCFPWDGLPFFPLCFGFFIRFFCLALLHSTRWFPSPYWAAFLPSPLLQPPPGSECLKGRRVLPCGGRRLGLGLDILGLLWGRFASFPRSVKWMQYCAPRNNAQSRINQVSSIKNVHKVAHNFLFLPFKYLPHP